MQNICEWPLFMLYQTGCPEVFYENGFLKAFTKFTGKHLCWNLFYDKYPIWSSATLLKKRLQRKCFALDFEKFLKAPILQNICKRLFCWCHVRKRKLSHVVEQPKYALCFLQRNKVPKIQVYFCLYLKDFLRGCVSHFKKHKSI